MIIDPWTVPSGLDRCDQRRSSDTWVAEAWRSDAAVLVAVDDEGRLACDAASETLRFARPAGAYDPERHVLVGAVAGGPVFAARVGADGPVASLRTLNPRLEGAWLEVATAAVGLLHWHALDPRCAGCGGETTPAAGGTTRRCASCGRIHFPRTDAAIIVAVVNDADEILLGHQASWAEGRVSLLAGFVESGESLEQAVHREIAEESGVTLREVSYVASQPWPFPRSLMVGFAARAASTEIEVDGEEIEYARWFSREALTAELAAGTVSVPNPGTIAHRMIEAWREGNLGLSD